MNTKPAIALASGVALVIVGLLIVLLWPDGPDVRIYSSLPEREQQQPIGAAGIGSGDDRGVVTNERTTDMENAMRLALEQAGGKAGDLDVTYEPLDDSDVIGESPAAVVQANARRAADDDSTAVYICDFTSDATQESIPILSRARIPQISVSSTRVGLTKQDLRGDVTSPTAITRHSVATPRATATSCASSRMPPSTPRRCWRSWRRPTPARGSR